MFTPPLILIFQKRGSKKRKKKRLRRIRNPPLLKKTMIKIKDQMKLVLKKR